MPLLARFLAVLCQMTPSKHLPSSVSTVAGWFYSFHAPLLCRILNKMHQIQKITLLHSCTCIAVQAHFHGLCLQSSNCKPFSISYYLFYIVSCAVEIFYPYFFDRTPRRLFHHAIFTAATIRGRRLIEGGVY